LGGGQVETGLAAGVAREANLQIKRENKSYESIKTNPKDVN